MQQILKCGLLCCVFSLSRIAAADDWPQFLGLSRTGVSNEHGLLDKWPTGGPKEVWRTRGGVGMSGLAISRGRLVTLVQKEGKQWLISLDAKSGKPQWETPLAAEYRNQQGNGPRATPTIAGESVVAFTGDGTLAAVGFSDGKIAWSKNVVSELGGKVADYGMASSPLIVGDLVVVTVGAPQACVVAYRLKTGELVWKAGDDPPGYSSPVLMEIGGRRQVVIFTGGSAVGLVPESGAMLWRYPYETDYDCNIATPVAVDGKVFISAGENHGSVLLKLTPKGEKFAVEEVWQSQGTQSVLRCEWQTPILLESKLYGLDNVGSAGPVTNLTCIDAASGKRLWQQPRFGKSNAIAADGKLFFSTMGGELVVVRVSPAAYEEIGRQQIIGPTRQAPSLSDGLIYLRDEKEIVCLDGRQ